ncbi:hypothetical protein BFP97_01315 [Roseivirga sp. 4D4]|uniref:hypothetical protein n=1 Tax=Roseivirga sp. 4D4 TaxID=1889784 RepID=UPI000852F2F6|nr:hypothetical protein [Roseivirga sp. 4D4]OEK00232.1 hypothetical protein BFP97_01315 [Roseivirga sp. 4D4]
MINQFNKLKKLNSLPKQPKTSKEGFLKGAFWGLFLLSLFIMAFAGFYFRTGLSPYLQVAVYLLAGIIAFHLFRWVGTLASAISKSLPTNYVSLILAVIGVYMLARYMRLSWPQGQVNLTLGLGMLGMILIGGSVNNLIRGQGSKVIYGILTIAGLASLYYPVSGIVSSGEDPYPLNFVGMASVDLASLGVDNPASKGTYEVESFTYGSGKDIRRPEFAEGVKYKTEPVDGRLLLPEWKGKRKKWRERYWGFGIDEAPINGRVWMPKKEEKSPLILIVHGNHGMEHHSDPGYAYLGELLASRGFITVSVDENYINGTWSGDFRGREMPIRAWLLLKHLEQWQKWSTDPSADLFEKADLNQVMLMGHSRGGEAVSIAAAYNKLPYFPDNANVKFDFNFGIQGIVTIAPTDQRYFRRMKLENINYLSLQGSYDADEASFFGLRQYQRVKNSDSTDYFKAGVLIHKANHGQFNSIWGRRDFGEPYGWFLNTGALISGEEQRQAAKVFIGAFAERTFNKKQAYDEVFKNAYSAKPWLPNTVFLNNYQDAHDQVLFDFEGDINLNTGKSGIIKAENLMVWREEPLKMRGGETQGTNAVILGWAKDSISGVAKYSLTLDQPFSITPNDEMILSLGRTSDSNLKVQDTVNVDFTINLITPQDTIRTTLLAHKKLAPKLKVRYMKLDKMNGSFGGEWEIAMESAHLPLKTLRQDSVSLTAIEFVFDKTNQGLIALDNIGFRKSLNK